MVCAKNRFAPAPKSNIFEKENLEDFVEKEPFLIMIEILGWQCGKIGLANARPLLYVAMSFKQFPAVYMFFYIINAKREKRINVKKWRRTERKYTNTYTHTHTRYWNIITNNTTRSMKIFTMKHFVPWILCHLCHDLISIIFARTLATLTC